MAEFFCKGYVVEEPSITVYGDKGYQTKTLLVQDVRKEGNKEIEEKYKIEFCGEYSKCVSDDIKGAYVAIIGIVQGYDYKYSYLKGRSLCVLFHPRFEEEKVKNAIEKDDDEDTLQNAFNDEDLPF